MNVALPIIDSTRLCVSLGLNNSNTWLLETPSPFIGNSVLQSSLEIKD